MNEESFKIAMKAAGFSEEVISRWHAQPERDADAERKEGTIRIAKQIASPNEEAYEDAGKYVFTPAMMREFLEKNEGKDIVCEINSGGGSVFGGSEICSLLNAHDGHTKAFITGVAASAAAEIALACEEIEMGPSATMMCHAASTVGYGNANEFRRLADMLDTLTESSRKYYEKRMDKELVDKIMKDGDHWFNAEECLEMGICDRVTDIKGSSESNDDKDKEDRIKSEIASLEAARILHTINRGGITQ